MNNSEKEVNWKTLLVRYEQALETNKEGDSTLTGRILKEVTDNARDSLTTEDFKSFLQKKDEVRKRYFLNLFSDD